MADIVVNTPDRKFIQQVKAAGGDSVGKCFQCATCSVVCDLSTIDRPFPRKEMIWTQWGQKDKLMSDPDVWLCHQCGDCTVNCPKQANPSELMAAIRTVAFKYFAFPGFMGAALAKPAGLFPLFLLPFIILSAIVWQTIGCDFASLFNGSLAVDFDNFLPHGQTEMLFIIGAVLVVMFTSVSLVQFWRSMDSAWGEQRKVGFISALFSIIIEIILHKRFKSCGAARYRQLAHLLVFYGFVLTAAATAVATIEMLFFHKFMGLEGHYPPFSFIHPAKIFGNLGGFAIVIGIAIMIYQRITNTESAGKASYTMWLFIWITGIVAVSGLGAQFFRAASIAELAYPFYFLHMMTVFFLIWYAPYSQFGHMFYRSLAMVFARSISREARELR
ncbi:MAG: quinone-interacting membrane-bound oxidoreductase complex subunit QmoC [Calditrichaeota bacterium]|nr:quinone-interacting membrane-bound oxidoreductase complex subunit QmoC [Calditrichota bacterium]